MYRTRTNLPGPSDDAALLYEDQHSYAWGYYAVYFEDCEGIEIEVLGPENR